MKTAASALRAWAAGRLWAIRPGTLDALIDSAGERLALAGYRYRPGADLFGDGPGPPEPDGPEPRTVEVRDGVAVIPVVGPLVDAQSDCERMMLGLMGGTDYSELRAMLDAAVRAPEVSALMLDIDSPGGDVSGVAATADAIRAAAGAKPTAAHVRGNGASAAYWLATAAPRITGEPLSFVGSIGVVGQVRDDRRQLETAGIDVFDFVSQNAPDKRPDLRTEGGRRIVQAHIDAIEDVFLNAVAAGRSVPVAKVLDDFGRGDVLIAAEALDAGMIDAIAGRSDALAQLAGRGRAAKLAGAYPPNQPFRAAARAAAVSRSPLIRSVAVARRSI